MNYSVHVSDATIYRAVKAYLHSVYQKFGVDSRAAAVAVAAGKGLLDS